MSDHTHQELEDRISLEISTLRGDLQGQISAVQRDLANLSRRTSEGFEANAALLERILARLPEPDEGS